jgi:uncharacterized membrane protein YqhA
VGALDDLKDRLAKVIMLILVVRFFEFGLRLTISGLTCAGSGSGSRSPGRPS